MFGELVLGVIVGAVFLWLPGSLFLASLRLDKFVVVGFAPAVSALAYSIVGVIYAAMGIFATWWNVALPPLLIGIIACAVRWSLSRSAAQSPATTTRWFQPAVFAAYLACGIILVSIFFVGNLGYADAILQEFDNVHHLGVLRTFAETGRWSFFDVSAYGGIESGMRAVGGWSFYPTVWHLMGALLVDCLGISVPLAANAVNALFTALVLPAGMFMLLRKICSGNRVALVCGTFLTFAFAAFPWKFLIWGPLFPNLVSYALLPSVTCLFLDIFRNGATRWQRILDGCLFVAGVLCLAIAQTNAIFTMAVFLIPFCIMMASRAPLSIPRLKSSQHTRLLALRLLFGIVAAVAIGIIWIFFYHLPFLSEVVTHVWLPFTDWAGAVQNIALLAFNGTRPQPALSILVLVGIIYTFRHREHLWITAAFAFMCFIYAFCAATGGHMKQVLGGFWYTDTIRLGASAALYAVPLACFGLAWIMQGVSRLTAARRFPCLLSALVAALFAALIFLPLGLGAQTSEQKSAFADIADTVKLEYANPEINVYTPAEREFVQKVMQITGDSLILNVPDDGSAFAFGSDGLHTFYRYTRPYGEDDETAESLAIREGLNNISTDAAMQDAVEKVGAEYVIKLDQGDQYVRANRYLFTYDEKLWEGIDAIDDETPGFELVLSEDDMRLYKIA